MATSNVETIGMLANGIKRPASIIKPQPSSEPMVAQANNDGAGTPNA